MTFSTTFVLLQQEAYLTRGILAEGLTALRTAAFPDKATFYSGFFNTAVAFERVMKLVVVADHMLQHSSAVPTKTDLKAYGHDLVSLYKSSIAAASRVGVGNLGFPPSGSIEAGILSFLSEFARTTRYYNLDALSSPSVQSDPLASWEAILNDVLVQDVPQRKMQAQLDLAKQMHDLMAGSIRAIQHGMDGKQLSLLEVFNLPVKHQLAVPYTMVRVFRLLTPLLTIIGEQGRQLFYCQPRSSNPQAPLFHEFFVHFGGSDAEIRRKKRWP
ncbi:hypothetical protein [Piscinibacter terrae]|uniref:hypothetical protein n=1 Tax=Piscinibacter terrae TaxID=2496871 RepID=UPI000F5A0EDA|nr:hypothetical protein [Albitalea terrae]